MMWSQLILKSTEAQLKRPISEEAEPQHAQPEIAPDPSWYTSDRG